MRDIGSAAASIRGILRSAGTDCVFDASLNRSRSGSHQTRADNLAASGPFPVPFFAAENELVFGASDRHVEQPSFFLAVHILRVIRQARSPDRATQQETPPDLPGSASEMIRP